MSSELVGLTADERGEVSALESEMADTTGQRYQGDWHSHYWHSAKKQARYRDLLSKAERGSPPAAPASRNAEEKARALIASEDYWRNPDLQEQVRRLLSGEAADDGDGDAPPARRADLGSYAEALGVGEEDAAAMLSSWRAISSASDDPAALQASFDELPDEAQTACLKVLATPSRLSAIVAGLSPAAYRAVNRWLRSIEDNFPNEHRAIRRALELA